MRETVRVAISDDMPPLEWPAMCPKCGTRKGLRPVTSRLGRVASIRPGLTGLTMRSDILYLSFPACQRHAARTRWSNLVLDNSPVARVLRLTAYVGLLFLLALIVSRRASFGPLSIAYALYGLAGTAAIVRARTLSAVRPLRFDPDMDVIELSFAEPAYATRFRAVNREATSLAVTEAPPWYLRAGLWKAAVLGLGLLFVARMIAR